MTRRRTLLHVVNILGIGGAEGQFVERVRSLDPRRFRSLVATLKRTGPHLERCLAHGLDPKEFPLASSLAHPATVEQVLRLAGFMRRERVELVHSQDFYSNLVALPAARLAGAKIVVSRLDLAHWHGPRRRKALAWATRLADRVQVNAWAIEEQIVREEGINPERIEVIENGIDLEAFDRRLAEPLAAPLPVPEGAQVATIVANLRPIKGQVDAVDALAGLTLRFPDLHLLLVGDGEGRERILQRVRQRRLGDRVHFLGHRLDVPAILARSSVLISSSHAEGLSNSIIEGMAARLPVVATAVGGSGELVADGESGRLVPAFAPLRLAEALAHVLADEARRRAMGHRGREIVESRLRLELMARRFEALYDSLLGERPTVRAPIWPGERQSVSP